jgi:hypothetical protein
VKPGAHWPNLGLKIIGKVYKVFIELSFRRFAALGELNNQDKEKLNKT